MALYIICCCYIQSTPIPSALVVLFPHVTFKSVSGAWIVSTNRTCVHKCVSKVLSLYVVHQMAFLETSVVTDGTSKCGPFPIPASPSPFFDRDELSKIVPYCDTVWVSIIWFLSIC